MHQAAFDFVSEEIRRLGLNRPGVTVLDLGGRDVNGTTRHLFTAPSRYLVVDIEPHPSVDIIADASTLCLDELFDVVTSTECLEHTDRACGIVRVAAAHLCRDGVFLATMAGEGRAPHSAVDGGPLRVGEFYRNVSRDELDCWLHAGGFAAWKIDRTTNDLRCVAWKG